MISKFIDEEVYKYVETFSTYDEKYADLVEYAQINHVPIISADVARFIELLLSLIKPKKILEIGSAIGYSSLIMMRASDADILTIEKDEDTYKILLNNLKKYEALDRVTAINADAIEALKGMEKTNLYDFCFIDANKSQYKEYLDLAYDLTSQNATILIDNVLFRGYTAKEEENKRYRTIIRNLKEFIEGVKSDNRFKANLLTVHDGLLLLRKV